MKNMYIICFHWVTYRRTPLPPFHDCPSLTKSSEQYTQEIIETYETAT